jgi:hypothetical protein
MPEIETHLIIKNGRRYWISEDGQLFNDNEKFIGWYKDGVYRPSSDIQIKRDRIDCEARKRLAKAKFEDAVKKRMNELRKTD